MTGRIKRSGAARRQPACSWVLTNETLPEDGWLAAVSFALGQSAATKKNPELTQKWTSASKFVSEPSQSLACGCCRHIAAGSSLCH
jgi:hypothetical protein